MNKRPMTEEAERMRTLLDEANTAMPGAGWITTKEFFASGVRNVVASVATLLDDGAKIRADWCGSQKCCRYRLLTRGSMTSHVSTFSNPKSEVRDAASKGIGKRVWEVMKDGHWHTPDEVAEAVGISPHRASSAFRRFGYSDRVRYKVEKQWIGPGANRYQYRITEAQACVNT